MFNMGHLRHDQERAVSHVLKCLERRRVTVLRAPTGFGKTLTGIEIARRWGESTVVAVRTRNQLSRYVEDMVLFYNDVPRILLNRLLTCFKYGSNCKSCLFNNVLDKKVIISNRLFDPYSRDVLYFFRSRGACLYRSFTSIDSNLTVCTYPFIIHSRLRRRIGSPSLLIIDEAHNIENITSIVIDVNRVLRLLSMFLDVVKRRRIRDSMVLHCMNNVMTYIRSVKNLDHVREILTCLETVFSRLFSDSSPPLELAELFVEVCSCFETVLEMGLDYITYDNNMLMFRTLDLEMIGRFLEQFDRVVLMSATLPDRWFLRQVWGIDDVEVIDVDYRYDNISISIIPDVTSRFSRRSVEMYRSTAAILDRIVSRADKNVLIFFPSYEYLRNTARHMRTRIEQVSDIGEAVKLAREGKHVYADVIGGRLSEGIELVDRVRRTLLVSDLTVVGIPYPKYDEYMRRLLKRLEDRGIRPEVYLIEKAWTGVRQAIGRACRLGYSGHVRIWLLDERYRSEIWLRKIYTLSRDVRIVPACSIIGLS